MKNQFNENEMKHFLFGGIEREIVFSKPIIKNNVISPFCIYFNFI